jgi:hypothetical protein
MCHPIVVTIMGLKGIKISFFDTSGGTIYLACMVQAHTAQQSHLYLLADTLLSHLLQGLHGRERAEVLRAG